ncbi:hypothetical protein BLS_007873 [Venturia inaequalis]|uniref:tRNA pseudouridine synthase 1 n=1 Tax=Venturia inaequalis TaxID=5025 RepID=A0A8H3UV01_VENIN|nr:hypothetical protein EG328_002724 [Venturia inaequalis]KAE9981100.1 hypothetical protein BLS_007873 [Venturia inaequalis]KAE9987042.1 hypothetical protein EG327_004026 [Venturia inaequalis]RDI79366.1 hypothetical protein Vi05172_g10659 [Venturia inaequalis]
MAGSDKTQSDSRGQKRKRGNDGGRPNKGRDMGRGEYFRSATGRRQRNEESQAKRGKWDEERKDGPVATNFTKEEIEADSRQPKRKVAVMLGYSGSGYKGMQMMPDQPTIEGDLFKAFVAAGAISKANADDPKKSSFVRCARTDKGVHAAGNVISLKLIIEDPDIIKKINDALSPQIRVWGIERTTGSFSCYQACDSRWYEYLLPTSCYLPPHPKSYMGKKLVELAEEVGDTEGFNSRQEEVASFWEDVEAKFIQPILEGLDEDIRVQVEEALYRTTTDQEMLEDNDDDETSSDAGDAAPKENKRVESGPAEVADTTSPEIDDASTAVADTALEPVVDPRLQAATKSLKAAYIAAKKTYRIPQSRLTRVQEVFAGYEGTRNYHNYTVRKSFSDPSSKRHIFSFAVNPKPIIIGDTEWISLKVHGQSFMMHQIRKMVGMASLMVRCGTPLSRLEETFTKEVFSIPKAPGLGLLLERPVFNNYNNKVKGTEREKIDFGVYEKEIDEFKHREIYNRIFREEEQENIFHSFFAHIDNFRDPAFLFLSSKGLKACGKPRLSSSGQGQLSKSQRKGTHKNRRNKIAGDRKKEDDEMTLIGEEEENAVKEVVEAAALKTEAEGVSEEVVKIVEKEVEYTKAADDVVSVKDVVS